MPAWSALPMLIGIDSPCRIGRVNTVVNVWVVEALLMCMDTDGTWNGGENAQKQKHPDREGREI